ncbi:MAG: glycosyltransferase [Bacteroidota bacterium]
MIYLTYGEPPSGVYFSQVTDVLNYLEKQQQTSILLVAFISLHDFTKKRKDILAHRTNAIVLPMLPKAPYWKFNAFLLWLLCLIIRPKAIIARNVIAANMALTIKNKCSVRKVCFDGRGAMKAEWTEYPISVPANWKNNIQQLEYDAVNKSTFRIAVTNKLVDHWVSEYHYQSDAHVVIPCTLNSDFNLKDLTEEMIQATRSRYHFNHNDLILVYSGSVSGWQSFSLLQPIMIDYLNRSKDHKLVFLSNEDEIIQTLIQQFPQQVSRLWLKHEEVTQFLICCDWGVLIREQSVTNRVASPTKFAEYLSAGLPVIISENLGDYTEFVKNNQCGIIFSEQNSINISKTSLLERNRLIALVQQNWTKQAQDKQYKKLIAALK